MLWNTYHILAKLAVCIDIWREIQKRKFSQKTEFFMADWITRSTILLLFSKQINPGIFVEVFDCKDSIVDSQSLVEKALKLLADDVIQILTNRACHSKEEMHRRNVNSNPRLHSLINMFRHVIEQWQKPTFWIDVDSYQISFFNDAICITIRMSLTWHNQPTIADSRLLMFCCKA